MELYYSGRNLKDASLPEVLSQLPEGPAFVHLCSIPSMWALVVRMKQHDRLSCCVWNNTPYFQPWYRMAQQEGVNEWVHSGRLRYGGHCDPEQDLVREAARGANAEMYQEKMRARLEEVKAIQAATARLQQEDGGQVYLRTIPLLDSRGVTPKERRLQCLTGWFNQLSCCSAELAAVLVLVLVLVLCPMVWQANQFQD